MGIRVGLILLLSALVPLNLVPCPKLDCRQSKRKALCGNRQTRMHQDTTTRMVIDASLVVLAHRTLVQPLYFINIFALETEFGRGN